MSMDQEYNYYVGLGLTGTLNDMRAKYYATDGAGVVRGEVDLVTGNIEISGVSVLSNHEKFSRNGFSKIGINCFDLLERWLKGGTLEQAEQKLDYAVEIGANAVRIMYPAFDATDYQSLVYSGPLSSTVTDASFEPSFLETLDAVVDACEQRGLKLWVSFFWWEQALPEIFGETVKAAFESTNSATVVHMKSHVEWFARRYKDSSAIGVYSFGNEYHMDTTGASYATPENLGAVFSYLANAIRAIDPSRTITADMLGPSASTVAATRELPESYLSRMRTVFRGLDAWAVHLYANDNGYVGRSTADGATIGAAAANVSGYESADAILCALRVEADHQGKPLVISEFGVPTDVESDAATAKALLHCRQVSRWADLAMIWNVQLGSQAGDNQTKWFIEPGTTRAEKFAAAIDKVQSATTLRYQTTVSACSDALKIGAHPTAFFKCAANANGRLSFVSDSSFAVGSGIVYMFWLRIDSDLSAFQILANLRGAGDLSGAVLLAQNTPSANAVYCDFRNASGSAGNTFDCLPVLQKSRVYHVAIWHQQDPSNGSVMDVCLDGVMFKSKQGLGQIVPTATGTVCTVGGATNGAPVSMQDFAVLPYASMDDVYRHVRGEVLPQSLVHIRATSTQVVDASRHARSITVGASVAVVRN